MHGLNLGFGGNGVRTHVTSKEKSPLPEAQRRIEPMTASRRTASPTHYRLSYSGPDKVNDADETFARMMAVMMKLNGSRGENDADHPLSDGPQTCVQDDEVQGIQR